MDQTVNIRKALRVFHSILDKGERHGNEYHLNGLRAESDFDGYTASLRNDYVSLDIFFHNKFAFHYSNSKEKDRFLEKIDAMDKT